MSYFLELTSYQDSHSPDVSLNDVAMIMIAADSIEAISEVSVNGLYRAPSCCVAFKPNEALYAENGDVVQSQRIIFVKETYAQVKEIITKANVVIGVV